MKRVHSFFIAFLLLVQVQAQKQTPDLIWKELFKEVQLKRIFPDNKTFVDAVPKFSPEIILQKYNAGKAKDSTFDLKAFVVEHFNLPQTPSVKVEQDLALKVHIEKLWETLQRRADTNQAYSSLLPLPQPYIVPGGRFRENAI